MEGMAMVIKEGHDTASKRRFDQRRSQRIESGLIKALVASRHHRISMDGLVRHILPVNNFDERHPKNAHIQPE